MGCSTVLYHLRCTVESNGRNNTHCFLRWSFMHTYSVVGCPTSYWWILLKEDPERHRKKSNLWTNVTVKTRKEFANVFVVKVPLTKQLFFVYLSRNSNAASDPVWSQRIRYHHSWIYKCRLPSRHRPVPTSIIIKGSLRVPVRKHHPLHVFDYSILLYCYCVITFEINYCYFGGKSFRGCRTIVL